MLPYLEGSVSRLLLRGWWLENEAFLGDWGKPAKVLQGLACQSIPVGVSPFSQPPYDREMLGTERSFGC
ncbi:hypothetical protein SAMN04487936_1227 [Halobacillus dabanensis]|uniref:Uncharacterized protein n=1 Tax=Halobacillus dabanensis TaxID=240302 RepID=A0A1I4AVT1_HALDA|nr:hypothetical protein SAMN04487936_1227 [Halobacillus dabanensis]